MPGLGAQAPISVLRAAVSDVSPLTWQAGAQHITSDFTCGWDGWFRAYFCFTCCPHCLVSHTYFVCFLPQGSPEGAQQARTHGGGEHGQCFTIPPVGAQFWEDSVCFWEGPWIGASAIPSGNPNHEPLF